MKKNIYFFDFTFFILWCVLIFSLSSVPSLKSDFPSYIDLILRKIFHTFEFFILVILSFRVLLPHVSKKKAFWGAVSFSLFFAFLDEYHQSFVFGRNGNIFDVMIDSVGIFMATIILKRKK